MKTPLIATALLCAGAFGFCRGAHAAPADSPSPSPAANPTTEVTPYQGLLLTTNVAGSHIKNLQNEDIGTIDDLIFNPDTGRVRFAVLSVGGFLGAGGTKVVVPWGAVGLVKGSPGEAPGYVIDATKDKLTNAPKFDPNKLTDLYARTAAQPIFDYFGITFFDDVPAPGQTTAPTGKRVTGTPTPEPGASATGNPMNEPSGNPMASPSPGATGIGLGTSMGNPVASPGASPSLSPTPSPGR
ncbi:MAG: PRC-barrel domain-containing protein [Verrucomicrobia bacterium]|nr:PRC-barrel domain-containing protein [Verrucomicrobiota bacterium]